jgi:hypothetical protein
LRICDYHRTLFRNCDPPLFPCDVVEVLLEIKRPADRPDDHKGAHNNDPHRFSCECWHKARSASYRHKQFTERENLSNVMSLLNALAGTGLCC